MIKYDKLLKILKERNITLAQLRSMGTISASAVDKIRNNKSVQVEALFRVCDFLNCKMDDIVEHENYVELDKSVADFGLTESGYGFDILGIKTISDITAPLTIGNLQNKMCEYYTSCKLNRNDCDVIMN
ncbi:MAG: helix-turn-helix transcriptional regulator, partial [Clostridia bacterium]|nr:helix-turn-helix transcriptional regulator [Clostridia bacterium]